MKILIVIASPKLDGNTFNLSELITDRISSDIDVEVINLYQYKILNCRACKYCSTHKSCFIDDDFLYVSNKMFEADMILFGIPTYFGNVPALLKSFFDRSLSLRKKDYPLANKVGGVFVTGKRRNGGLVNSIKQCHEFFIRHNMLIFSVKDEEDGNGMPYGLIKLSENYGDKVIVDKYTENYIDGWVESLNDFLLNHFPESNLLPNYFYSNTEGRLDEEDIDTKKLQIISDGNLGNISSNVIVGLVYDSADIYDSKKVLDFSLDFLNQNNITFKVFDVNSSINFEDLTDLNILVTISGDYLSNISPRLVEFFLNLNRKVKFESPVIGVSVGITDRRNSGDEGLMNSIYNAYVHQGFLIIGGSCGSQYGPIFFGIDDKHALRALNFVLTKAVLLMSNFKR